MRAIIGGYVIPSGTMVLANLVGIMNDPLVFPNPTKFDPERFLDEDGKFTPHPSVMHFSVGRRRCPGEDVSKTQILLFVAGILRKFRVEVDPASRNGKMVGNVHYFPEDIRLMFFPRNN